MSDAHVQAKEKAQSYKDMPVNSPRSSTRDGKRKMVLASENGQKKLIHYGDSKMGAHPDDPDRKSNFRARHSCDEKKSKLSAGYWACKDW